MKVVINRCYGGFSLSDTAFERYLDLKGITWYKDNSWRGLSEYYNIPVEEYEALYEVCKARPDSPDKFKELNGLYLYSLAIERNDPLLIQIVEELGEESWGKYAELKIVDVPDDVQWEIAEYVGLESVKEISRSWT